MAEFNDKLQAKLWAVFNDGFMPSAIRIDYAVYSVAMIDDDEFNHAIELAYDEKPLTYQSLPFIFDSWCKEPQITKIKRE